jgi:uncharacterized membrane protein
MTLHEERIRLSSLDALRGVAVALMVLDHSLVIVAPDSPFRYTLTRLALPLFMYCTAYTLRMFGSSNGRLVTIASAGVLVSVASGAVWPALNVRPDVCLLIVGAILAVRWWLPALGAWSLAVLGFVQALYVPLGWHGYEPGLVLGWLCVGLLAVSSRPDLCEVIGERVSWLAPVGRRALVVYVGHLGVLAVVANLAGVSGA